MKKAPAKTDAFFQFNSKLNGVFFFVQHFLLIRADITNTIYSTKTLYSAKPGQASNQVILFAFELSQILQQLLRIPNPSQCHLRFAENFNVTSSCLLQKLYNLFYFQNLAIGNDFSIDDKRGG